MWEWLKNPFKKDENKIEKVTEEIKEQAEKIQEKVQDKNEEILEEAEETKHKITEKSEDIKKEVQKEFEETKGEISKEAKDLKKDLEEKKEELKEKTEEITEELEDKKELLKDEVKENSKEIKEKFEAKEEKPQSIFSRLFSGLEKTRSGITDKIAEVLGSYVTINDELYEELEDILISADVGVSTTIELIDRLKKRIKEEKIKDVSLVFDLLKDETKKLAKEIEPEKVFNPNITPTIILVVGVNGVGKTTTIGKLSAKYKNSGKKVLIAAADTFRAAAIEQLEEWANRSGVDIIKQNEGSDPASVIFDAIQAAKARKADILICDTAGRLHNKKNLMNELDKIYRVIDGNYPEANIESLIVLDATTGQNAIVQAKSFKESAKVTGAVITKLDGTAKGGVILPIIHELKIPVIYIGVGEKIDDLQEFDSDNFIDSIFSKK